MQCILSGTMLNKYKLVMLGCKELEKGVYGQQWTLVETKDVTMEQFWAWAEVDFIYGSGDMFLGTYR